MKRFRPNLAVALLMVFVMLFSVTPISLAQALTPSTLTDDDAIVMLQAYGIVKGDENGSLNLGDNITRAQSAAIFVRALGQSELAQYLKDSTDFSDTRGHWAAGEVAMAKRLGLMQGADGFFRPDDPITYAELMTVMLRMVGKEPAGPWDREKIMLAAEALGVAPATFDVKLLANVPAVRGKVFKSLAVTIATIPVEDGKTLLAKHIDSTPPQLTVDTIPQQSSTSTLLVSGQATEAFQVTVNGQVASRSGSRFSAQVTLQGGENTITVEAVDFAGNKITKTHKVSMGGAPARIEVTGSSQVAAGGSASIKATPYDANGITLAPSTVAATVTGGIGTYDAATGTFRASATGGKGIIRFTAGSITKDHEVVVTGLASEARSLRIRTINEGRVVTLNRAQTVVVEVLDGSGNPISYDTGRSISLTASPAGVSVTQSSVTTNAGIASFTITPNQAGAFTLSASATGLAAGTAQLIAGTSTRVVLTATPSTMPANGTSATLIRATLQDEAGNPVINNTSSDITLTLAANGANGAITGSFMMIPRGAATSAGYDGQFVSAFDHGNTQITGRMTSSHSYTVQPVAVTLTQVVIGTPSRLELMGGGGSKLPGEEVTLTVRVTDRDGNMITTGNYAFQLEVTTSNTQDSIYEGVPEDSTVYLGNTLLSPVTKATTPVYGRTEDGLATIKVQYGKSGKLKIKTVGVSATQSAYDSTGELAAASSTSGWQSVERELFYDDLVGKTAGLELVWDLPQLNLTEQDIAILQANGSGSAKLRVYLVDQYGGRRPTGDGQVALSKTGNGSRASATTATLVAGVAEFNITSASHADVDTYTVTYGTGASQKTASATLQAETTRADKPTIWSIYGESGDPTKVDISDRYMAVELSAISGKYGVVKVYSVNSNRVVYTSPVMNLSGSPMVQVPKESLRDGADRYRITVNTGAGESTSSDPYPSSTAAAIVNARPVTIDISTVRYDARTQTLKVTASGVTTSSGGTIYPEKLTLRKSASPDIPLSGATCLAASSSFTCDLSGFGLTADAHNGAWLLDAADGWFVKTATGDSAAADTKPENNYVTPFAYIREAALDVEAGRITLYGVNLNQGTIYLNKLLINSDSALPLGTSNATSRPSDPNEVTITLPSTVATAVKALTGSITLSGTEGWLVDSYSNQNGEIMNARPVLASVNVGRASYDKDANVLTIYGSNLQGGTVDLTKLVIKNRSNVVVLRLTADDTVQNLDVDSKLDANQVTILLSAAHATALEAGGNDANVFLSSDPTDVSTNSGWFLDANGRYGTAIRERTFILNW